MIYNSLNTIPYKLFVDIEKTGKCFLLNTNITRESDLSKEKLDELVNLWNVLYEVHLGKHRSEESKKIFKLSKKIDHLISLSKVMVTSCDCLRFEYNPEIHSIVTDNGFKLATNSTEAYYKSIDRIERESNNFVVQAEYYKKMLPERKESEDSKDSKEDEFTIDDVLASYCAILGLNIGDFNTLTYNQYFAYQMQVENKINSIKKQNSEANGKK